MLPNSADNHADIVVIGAGAAGLAAAIFAARRLPDRSIIVLDGARTIGAKILVAGGGRCNVTNRVVTPADYAGGSRNVIRRVLAALPVAETVEFFHEIGVELCEEEHGKLFPNTNRARTVLDALLSEANRRGVRIRTGCRATAIGHGEIPGTEGHAAFQVVTSTGPLTAQCIVLATGGRSLPKTGSDGAGYQLAQHLGHSLVPTTPALAPLLLDGDFHVGLSGVSQDVELTVRAADQPPTRLRGSLLWTHFGVSGPVVLGASRHWHRARLEQRDVAVYVNFLPGDDFTAAERKLVEPAAAHPKASLHRVLSQRLPARVAAALLANLGLEEQTPLGQLSRAARRKLVHALLEWPLPVRDSRGYGYAEVTAGGVPLEEIDPTTMASRKCPGLYLVGEILDVDGRIGGFNFQWAWSSAFVAANGLSRRFEGSGSA
jgi:predicted Rossmann fold flavoprotein